MVITEKLDPKTTSCPVKSASPSICLAILKDETAVGEAKIANKMTKFASFKSNKIANGKKIIGQMTSFSINPIDKCLIFP